jgi:excisionase family DNA binding protein
MAMTIGETASRLGVSEKTIRRRIKKGVIRAVLSGSPQMYRIHDEEIERLGFGEICSFKPSDKGKRAEEVVHEGHDEVTKLLVEQIKEKDRQIKELHILLQGSQEQHKRIVAETKGSRGLWWWPFR